VKTAELTEPEFAVQIPESHFVVIPLAVEVHTTVLASLDHLEYCTKQNASSVYS